MTGEDGSELRRLITRWREDAGATYRSWFLWDERLKNFRSIRRGIAKVVEEIEAGTFGNVYKGSSLEVVVGSQSLGFDVWIAANDRSRAWGGGRLGDGCLDALPAELAAAPGCDAVRLIDVLWLDKSSRVVAAAFEVEHSTSIYSGIVRLLDLANGAPDQATRGLFLVAPDGREEEVRAQLRRPAFQSIAHLDVRYLPYSELEKNRDAMARFGSGLKAIEAVARRLVN